MKNIVTELIFDPNEHFSSCHAATLCQLEGDEFLASWFAGSREGGDDVAIWISKRRNRKWSTPVKAVKINRNPHWNPVLFSPEKGRVLLYFKTGKKILAWKTWVVESHDGGDTWSPPKELVKGDLSGGRGPVKNRPIKLSNGDWLAPASRETLDHWRAFVDISKDGGVNWEKSDSITFGVGKGYGKGVIQPTIWESSPGDVHMLLRSTSGWIARSDSKDFGRTWSDAKNISLPNNNSGLDSAKLRDGTLVLACNPTSNPKKRTPLTLFLSRDNGHTWNQRVEVSDVNGGELSYPTIIALNRGVAMVHTHLRKSIAFNIYDFGKDLNTPQSNLPK